MSTCSGGLVAEVLRAATSALPQYFASGQGPVTKRHPALPEFDPTFPYRNAIMSEMT
jgi:hypothetical protein